MEAPFENRLRVGLIQMNGSNEVAENIAFALTQIAKAAEVGCNLVQLPEVANLVERDPQQLAQKIVFEQDCTFLSAMKQAAHTHKLWLHIGSLALKNDRQTTKTPPPMAVNRGIMLDPEGIIHARYDKCHMFDVSLAGGEVYRESDHYLAGEATSSLLIDQGVHYGLSICYDVRFPEPFRAMARQGVNLFGIPAAFTQTTGKAHWHCLLRARAIECSAFVLAAAQTGSHKDGRKTYGHSMVIDPWGTILAEAGEEAGLIYADLDLAKATKVRNMIPAWSQI